jgi:signal transduction histidine kinase/DNA-binding response OmpR family regulator
MNDDSRPTILIVDDETSNIQILAEALDEHYELVFATTGPQALGLAAALCPDLILLDVLMPGMDGYEVCARLKASPVTADIPVIFVSALGDVGAEARGLELGARDYITKPISPPVVKVRVRGQIALKTARDSLTRLVLIQGFAAEVSRGFLVSTRPSESFSRLLDGIVRLTGSDIGFLGHVLSDDGGSQTMHACAIIGCEEGLDAKSFMEFRNLDNLFGHTIQSGETVIANHPATDPRAAGLPDGHPPLKAYLGVPLLFEGRMVGMVGVGNRPGGYDRRMVDEMEAVWAAAASILHAAQKEVERKHAVEAAESANRAKSEFLSSMSHELRTPLNAVIGFAQMLDFNPKEPLSAIQRKCVQRILGSGQHLLELVNEILDLSRIEEGRISLSIEAVKVNGLLEECCAQVQSLADRQDIRVGFIPCSGVLIRADYTRLRQVVLNLLSNAIKYNRPNGEVTIGCRIADGAMAVIEVVDTGIGIPDGKRDSLFRPFSRLGQENSAIEGTGIGLTISKRLVELMGGSIGFDSVVGEGSTFRAELPLSLSTSSAADPSRANAAGIDGDMRGTVLYVEDNPANIELMEMVFTRLEDVALLSAPSGELGLELALTNRPDLIILDLNLPGMDGFEVLLRLRAREETRRIPVFALTASATRRDIERGQEAGFDKYLTKPFDVPALVEAVHTVLDLGGVPTPP